MKEFKATLTIEAAPEKIWGILTDASSYPEWDPYCDKLEGRVALGEKLRAFTKLSPGRAFPVEVTELVPFRRMAWRGGMPFGLFQGVRTFTLTPAGQGRTTFVLHEVFRGPLLALIGRSLPDLTKPFEEFASGLKARAERDESPSPATRLT